MTRNTPQSGKSLRLKSLQSGYLLREAGFLGLLFGLKSPRTMYLALGATHSFGSVSSNSLRSVTGRRPCVSFILAM